MTTENLKKILNDHRLWLQDSKTGKRANLSGADLSGANLSGANLSGADLSGANLSVANLSWANLSWADLSGANLSGANLSGANLYEADLYEANFSKANLSGANLYEADFSWADLSGANLYEANFSKANLSMAENIYLFNKEGGRICYAVVHEKTLMVKAGCFWGTLIEFENACMGKYGNDKTENYAIQREYLSLISKSIYKEVIV